MIADSCRWCRAYSADGEHVECYVHASHTYTPVATITAFRMSMSKCKKPECTSFDLPWKRPDYSSETMYVIGVDPGNDTGFAFWDSESGKARTLTVHPPIRDAASLIYPWLSGGVNYWIIMEDFQVSQRTVASKQNLDGLSLVNWATLEVQRTSSSVNFFTPTPSVLTRAVSDKVLRKLDLYQAANSPHELSALRALVWGITRKLPKELSQPFKERILL